MIFNDICFNFWQVAKRQFENTLTFTTRLDMSNVSISKEDYFAFQQSLHAIDIVQECVKEIIQTTDALIFQRHIDSRLVPFTLEFGQDMLYQCIKVIE
jgi:hypothetical protein